MIDVAQFPAFKGFKEPKESRRDEEDDAVGAPDREMGPPEDDGLIEEPTDERDGKLNWTDVDESFRGAVRRMAFAGEKLGKLPPGCTFTVAVELRDEGDAPIGVSLIVDMHNVLLQDIR